MTVSWQPEEMGIQWIEVSVNGGTSVKGEEIDVLQKSQDSLLSGSLGGVDTVILVAFLVLSSILGVVLLMFLRDLNSRRDKGWENDYWDDLDDEESEKDEADGQALSIAAKAAEYDQIYSTESASAILQPASSANTQSGESSGGPSLPTTSQPTADPYGQAEQQATSAPAATTSAGGTGGAGTGSAVGDGDVGEDWVQDGNGHWWKKNDEGYWWRLGEDGQWHSADDSGYA